MPFISGAFARLNMLLMLIFFYGCSEQNSAPQKTVQYQPDVINPDYTGAMVEPQTGAILLWGSDGVIRRSEDAQHWIFIATPTTARLNDIQGNEQALLAIGDDGTLLRSTNHGRDWRKIATDTTANLKTLRYSAVHKRWFAAGTGGTLLRSDDEGLHWQRVALGRGLDMLDIGAVFVSPESQRLLLGGSRGLFGFSDDGGNSWQVMQLDLDTPLSDFYQFNNILVATSAYGKLLVSRDEGDSWQLIETDGQAFFNHSTFDREHNVFLLATHNGKVLRTADNADTWQLIDAPYNGVMKYLARVVFDSTQKSLRVFGHYGTHLVSQDGGLTWNAENTAQHAPFDDVLTLPDGKTFIGFGRGGLLSISRDSGNNWQQHQPQLDIYWRTALVTSTGSWVLAGELGYVLRSVDQGEHWQLVDIPYSNPMTPPTYRAMIEEPYTRALIAAGPTGTILRSADDGASWQEVHYTAFDDGEAFTDLLIDPVHEHIIAVEADGRHYLSTDHGQSWTLSRIGSDRKFWHGSVLTNQQGSVILITGQAGVAARSRDGGNNWELINTETSADLFGSFADTTHQQLFLLGAQGTLLRSRDQGQLWEKMELPVPSDLRRMIIDPATNALLAFGGDGTLLRSTDGGQNWQQVASNTTQELRDAVLEPTTGHLLITGRDGKVIRSADGGISWQPLPTHTASHFRSIAADPKSGALIAVGERIVQMKF